MWFFLSRWQAACLPHTTRPVLVLVLAVSCASAAPLRFRTHELPWAAYGTPYYASIETSVDGRCIDGGVELALAAGALPPGLELRGDALSGTPKQMGAFPLRLRASNSCTSVEQDLVLQVTGKPILRVSPQEIVFECRAGERAPAHQSVLVYGSWPEQSYTVTGAAPWLRLEPQTGATPYTGSARAADVVELGPAPAGLAPGTYETVLVFSVPGGANAPAVPVKLRVLADTAK